MKEPLKPVEVKIQYVIHHDRAEGQILYDFHCEFRGKRYGKRYVVSEERVALTTQNPQDFLPQFGEEAGKAFAEQISRDFFDKKEK